jgi:hypothetical protein
MNKEGHIGVVAKVAKPINKEENVKPQGKGIDKQSSFKTSDDVGLAKSKYGLSLTLNREGGEE